ncbi:hypothetical protein [Roseivivax sp. THAF30]|uniref:hypothetical protein n=1 Tax=Roseivivax sp. THAF30 TaxID=2587852 RepID=UPI001267A2F8|nr:hypothetical protein [Roseivivax sp. THAF30]QFT62072.1 hypothetical protein FIU91_03950 [Roseivivax sp. THAF30]
MNWLANVSLDELLQLKPKGFYRIANVEGRTVFTICRPDEPPEQYLCASPGIANQLRMSLTDEGLAGFVEGAW